MKRLASSLYVLCLLSQISSAADTIRDAVVQLQVTRRSPDLFRPWTRASPSKLTGSGAILEGNRILTNAHVVQFASQIFVQLQQGGDPLPAKVTAIAPETDLAIVELEDPQPIAEIKPLSLATELPAIKSTVNVYGYPKGGNDLSVTEGIVSRVEFTQYYYDGTGIRIQVDAALNPGNSGGPAMKDGEIIGLVFSRIVEADNIGYLIPTEEIRTFLDDIKDGSYEGKPRLFDNFSSAENPALRSYLKLPPDVTGVVVSAPYREDDDYPLRQWDVVTHIGPHPIDNQGDIHFNEELRLKFQYYVAQLAKEGRLELTIRRNGESMKIEVPVSPNQSLLLPALKDQYPRYLIYGPLTFTAGTQEYIRSLGNKGLSVLSRTNSPLVNRHYDQPAFEGEELVVVATRAFPHRITKGYGQAFLGVVTHMNETAVKNLRHFGELLRACKDEFIKFTIAGRRESLVFRRSEIEAATEEILTDEGIRYQCSPDLRDIWQ